MLIDLGNIKKYGIYLVAALCVVYNFGAWVITPAWWAADNTTIAAIDTIFGFLGLGSLRGKLADAFAGIDLGPVGAWITGKKTYILAIAGAAFTLATAFFGVTANTPWVMFVNGLFGALGIGTFASATVTYKNQALKLIQANPSKPATAMTAIFTKAAAIIALIVIFGAGAQAQGWDNFWHPRPPVAKQLALGAAAPATVWEFKPSLMIAATSFRPVSGAPWQIEAFNGAGPGLTYAYETQAADGSNYIQYSASAAFLMSGSSQQLFPSAALLVGILNNIVNIGGKYEFPARPDGGTHFSLLVVFAYTPTLN
jgi:hypothetical protein